MATAILLVLQHQDIFVLDIPRSLELGNGGGCLHAAKAPNVPYQTPEPKGIKRDIFIANLPVDHVYYHEKLQADIQRARNLIFSSCHAPVWCLPRTESLGAEELQLYLGDADARECEPLPTILSSLPNLFAAEESISHRIVLNSSSKSTRIQLSHHRHILVPGMSTFLWSSIEYTLGVLDAYATTIGPGLQFDIILMDPPWPNRSVRNASGYSTIDQQASDPFAHAVAVVARYRKPSGYVAIWITNKAAVRDKALKALTLLGFVLVEEWVWVKVTTKGEFITPLDGVWRRPYEILLILRHHAPPRPPLRRCVFAVPDLHSRKPNLKEMFSKLLYPSTVLELFARNLTSGWWCVGNEPLKFQQRAEWCCWPPLDCDEASASECSFHPASRDA